MKTQVFRIFILILGLLGIFGGGTLWAQLPCEPGDKIYEYIDLWEARGYISKVPPLRPYSNQYILSVLEDVSLRGGEDGRTAREMLAELTERFSLNPEPGHTSRFTPEAYYSETGADFPFTGNLHPLVSYSGRAGIWIISMPEEGDLLPRGTVPVRDYLSDWSDFDLFERNFLVRQSLSVSTSIGNENIYFNAGLNRGSYGPFFENGLIIGPQAPNTGQFALTWRLRKTIITIATFMLSASTNSGAGIYPGKYLQFHSITAYPFPWLELGILESVIYGGRFEPYYLVPLSEFFYFQGTIGFPDNSMVGFSGKIRFPYNLQYALILYIDDIHFNDVVRFDFDTKYKVALQTGLFWTPEISWLSRMALDYTMVTPYTYSHVSKTDINYQNYTTGGELLGPALEPNSDRVTLKADFYPLPWLKITGKGIFSRHGNASEGETDGDGTIFDDGFDDQGKPTFQETTRFLIQDVLEYRIQGGVDSELAFSLKGRRKLYGNLGYALEYVINEDLTDSRNIYNYFTLGFSCRF